MSTSESVQSVKQDNTMNLTPEQLAAIAERMGGTKLVPASTVLVQPNANDKWYFEGRNADGSGFYPVWSDGELLLAMLKSAAKDSVRLMLMCQAIEQSLPQGLDPVEACGRVFVHPQLDKPPSGKLPSPSA